MYGVSVKTTGSGPFWPAGLYTVAASSTPSRIGMRTPHRRSTSVSLAAAGAAGEAAARASKERTNSTARRMGSGTESLLGKSTDCQAVSPERLARGIPWDSTNRPWFLPQEGRPGSRPSSQSPVLATPHRNLATSPIELQERCAKLRAEATRLASPRLRLDVSFHELGTCCLKLALDRFKLDVSRNKLEMTHRKLDRSGENLWTCRLKLGKRRTRAEVH